MVKVWLTATATDGQANTALCALIAEQVGVPKSHVSIVTGYASRTKMVRIDFLSEAEVYERLADQ